MLKKIFFSLLTSICSFASLCGCSSPRAITGATDTAINWQEAVTINDTKQLISIRGADQNLPLILFVHGGLGSPYSALSYTFQDSWEKHFIVIHWDQRGSGKLYSEANAKTITAQQLTNDTIELTKYLLKKFNRKKLTLLAHSWGSYFSFRAIYERPELYDSYIGTGQNIGILREDEVSHDWVIKQARQRNDLENLDKMNRLGPPPYKNISVAYELKYNLIAKYGGFLQGQNDMSFLAVSIFKSPDLGLIDKIKYVIGMNHYEEALFKNENENTWRLSLADISKTSVPIFFIHGENDHTTDPQLAENFLSTLQAPLKKNIIIKDAAHFPFIDQKEKFLEYLLNIHQLLQD